MLRGTLIINAGPDAIARGMAPAVKKALTNGVKVWHTRFRPGHFRGGAEAKYGYKNRSVGYIRRKRKRNSNIRPLVLTGLAERMIKAPIRVTSGKLRAAGRMLGPWYFRQTPSTRNAPNMVAELLSTPANEREFLGAFIAQSISNDFDKIKTRKTVR